MLQLNDKPFAFAEIEINERRFNLALRPVGPLFMDEMSKVEVLESRYFDLRKEAQHRIQDGQEPSQELSDQMHALSKELMDCIMEALRLLVIDQSEFEQFKRSKDWTYHDVLQVVNYIVDVVSKVAKQASGPVKKNPSTERPSMSSSSYGSTFRRKRLQRLVRGPAESTSR